MGEGFVDYDAFFRGLAAGGFDGYAVYEMCSPLRGGGSRENLDRCARGSSNGFGQSRRKTARRGTVCPVEV
jgi:sugar phosphate isomerase/epimerase